MNKYESALETIWKMFNVKFGVKEMDKAIEFIDCKNTLQELIDKQNEYIYQMDKYEMQHEEMFEKMVELDKALDKACYWLNKNRLEAYCPFDLDLKDCDKGLCLSSEKCWKDYLLKESEKQ